MDVAAKLRSAVNEIPEGEHTAGLTAIVRHVEAAIGHYDRADVSTDSDAFTDCIYRTNQVYEGSLKEAFRILMGADPARKTLHDIERSFDADEKLRSRVLEQMKRYRIEYRNPSTHDYKLDFDQNEALLAILSVCGFAILLASQMRERVESNELKNDPDFKPGTKVKKEAENIGSFASGLASSIQRFLNNDAQNLNLGSREPLALVTAFLDQSGLDITRDVYVEAGDDWIEWDVIAKNRSGFAVPIEVITSRGKYSKSIAKSRIEQVRNIATAGAFSHAILVEGAAWGKQYVCEPVIERPRLTVFRVGRSMSDED